MSGSKDNRKRLREQYKSRPQIGGIYAITCLETGRRIIKKALDLKGSQNHFDFCRITNSCIDPQFQREWDQYGHSGFSLEVLDQLEKKENQTDREFADDIAALEELWRNAN